MAQTGRPVPVVQLRAGSPPFTSGVPGTTGLRPEWAIDSGFTRRRWASSRGGGTPYRKAFKNPILRKHTDGGGPVSGPGHN